MFTYKSGYYKIKDIHTDLIDYIKEELPILNKIIQADDALLAQVHPDDEFSRLHENDNVNIECWYMIRG